MTNTKFIYPTPRKILLTCALPYANGPIHIGHLVEHIQADIWNRFQKMQKNESVFLCADDTHGTPIMIEARKRGITPEELIAQAWKEHYQDLKDFQIDYDLYSSTNTDENRKLCEYFYSQMQSQGHIATKDVEQLYCEHDKMFLPDRFVKGLCPKCGAKDQYGDSCDVCSATYQPKELKDSFCNVCGNKPVLKNSNQLMFQVNHFKDQLKSWLPDHTSSEVANKMMEWFKEDLRDWDISRNAPYFGFQIPGTTDKFFYVWVDAPMGYISTTQKYCEQTGKNFDDFWKNEQKSEVYHFIGKDITYFHTLFWPALLMSAGFRSPTQVFVHGHLMVNGEKMSKSKGNNVTARTYLDFLDPMYLRYYYASKLNSGVDDLDLNFDDFENRVNAELVGKIANLASRGAQMLKSKMDGRMSELDPESKELIKNAQFQGQVISQYFENREYLKAMQEIRTLAELGNKYFDENAPWKTLTSDPVKTKQVLTTTLNLFRIISIYLKPVIPSFTQKVEKLFNENNYSWADSSKILTNHEINSYEMLAVRIDPVAVKNILQTTKEKTMATANPSGATNSVSSSKSGSKNMTSEATAKSASTSANKEHLKSATAGSENLASSEFISIDDFMKIDLRVAKIIEAEAVKEADKLLKLKVDLGDMGTRQIFAGIKSAYAPEQLVNRLTVVVANLAPRKMKFGMSEGMVLAAGAGGKELYILSPDAGAKPGDRIK